MQNMETVTHNGETYAIFFRKDIETENGVLFPTERSMPFQVGLFDRDAGYIVKPHRHPERDIHVRDTAEFLYIASGKITVTIFDPEWNPVHETVCSTGDFVLLLKGGHGMEMLEPTRLVEVKQGPYPGEGDAKIFRDAL